MKKRDYTKGGYTIIEMLISISIFLVIVTLGMSSLLGASAAHQKSQDTRSILDNLSFIMEDMSRNLRTGYNYHCGGFGNIENPKSCALGSNIFFENAFGDSSVNTDQWGYKVESQNDGPYNIYKSIDGGVTWIQLNPEEVHIDGLISPFSVLGAEPESSGDTQEPFVVIRLVGKIIYKDVETPFSLQTSVSQRQIDNI